MRLACVVAVVACLMLLSGCNEVKFSEVPGGVTVRYEWKSSLYYLGAAIGSLAWGSYRCYRVFSEKVTDEGLSVELSEINYPVITVLCGFVFIVLFVDHRVAIGEINKDGFKMSGAWAIFNDPIQYKFTDFSQVRLNQRKKMGRRGREHSVNYMILTLNDGSVKEQRLNEVQTATIAVLNQLLEAEARAKLQPPTIDVIERPASLESSEQSVESTLQN